MQIRNQIFQGDVIDRLKDMPEQSVNCVVTSPPYWGLRDYGVDGQIGLEDSPEAFVDKMVEVFAEVWRVLKDDGTLWLNIGDSYCTKANGSIGATGLNASTNNHVEYRKTHALRSKGVPSGLKHKDLVGIPWRLALALQSFGWYLRSDIVWSKPNPMPESVTDRPTKAHEYVFLLTKSPKYFYDIDAIRDPLAEKTLTTFGTTRKSKGNDAGGFVKTDNYSKSVPIRKPKLKDDGTPAGANKKTVWTVASTTYKGAHFATFPPALIEPCIKAGTPREVCTRCGAPVVRVTEKTKSFESGSGKSGNAISGKHSDKCQGGGDTGDIRKGPVVRTVTTGWEPTCECSEPASPGVVLDPFFGAGTTGLVAKQLGRDFVGIELNPEYVTIARKRLQEGCPLLMVG